MEYFLEHSTYVLEETEFGLDVTMTILVRGAEKDAFVGRVEDISNGSALYEVIDETFSFWAHAQEDTI